jgi:hypothetical protein
MHRPAKSADTRRQSDVSETIEAAPSPEAMRVAAELSSLKTHSGALSAALWSLS